MGIRRLLAVALWALPLVVPANALAQATSAPADESFEDEVIEALPPDTVSCFDYYSFGSVQAKLTASVASTVSGAPITFSGTIENGNPYPIVDGALYVKVFKDRGGANDGNGPDVVDQFFVKENITIPAYGSAPVEFEWRVPAYAVSGGYRIATFFTTGHKFNLLGLSFTDDIVGNTVPFKVVGEQEDRVSFNKASVSLNGEAYHFASFPPRTGLAPATVQATVDNTSYVEQQATIHWKVYQWDAQREENLVQRSESKIAVPAESSVPVSIVVNDADYPVYLVVGELFWRDTRSIIGVRFVREGVSRPRINFPGILTFPLKNGVGSTLFSCLHNVGEDVAPDGRLELTLKSKGGEVIAEHTYAGDIASMMMGVASAFTPSGDYDYAVLDAKLYSGSTLVDNASVVYDCRVIDPALCMVSWLDVLLATPGGVLVAGLVVLLVLIGGVAVVVSLKRTAPTTPSQESMV